MARNDSFNQPWASVPAQFERPGDGLIARGWAGGASEDPPEAKWENWWHNRVDLALQELQNLGQLIWFTDAPYQAGARVSHGGNSYIALSENTGVEPTGTLDIGVWRKEGASTYLQTANNLAEIAAAGPEAVAEAQSNLNLAELLGDALQKANNLSEIKDAGPAAIAQTLLNLGLGDAAKLGVATDAEVIAGLVGKAITAATLKSRFASVVLYPSGTEAVPPTLTAGQRIVIDNPFPGRPVSAEVEVFANGIWDSPNIMVAPQGNGGPSAGAKAKYLFDSDKIVIQTAGNGVLYLSIYSGSAHNFLSGGDVFSGTIFSARQYRLRVRTL
ncbi:hypothetical protein ACNSO7_26300 [Yersinia enterocolitica]|uniref:hypothetical protein n=1 Tax=Yersinia enterocolitica TaxID=630 RepID=UPI003AB2BE8A